MYRMNRFPIRKWMATKELPTVSNEATLNLRVPSRQSINPPMDSYSYLHWARFYSCSSLVAVKPVCTIIAGSAALQPENLRFIRIVRAIRELWRASK